MTLTTVENIYNYPEGPDTAYIGRAGKGKKGYFGNPFSNGTREENIKAYERWFHARLAVDAEFWYQVMSLEGKVLLCFCKPKACHGDIIADWINKQGEKSI